LIVDCWKNQYGSEYNNFIESWQYCLCQSDLVKKENDKKKEITSFRCKKIGHYSYEWKEELPKTSGNTKWTNLLISNNDSSDKDTNQDNSYESESDQQRRLSSTKDMSYEEEDLFSEKDYDGFAFVQDANVKLMTSCHS